MKKEIFLLLFTSLFILIFYSCNNEEDEVSLSTLTKIMEFKASSHEFELLKNTFFNKDHINHKIYNSDSLPNGTVIHKMKFEISTHFASKILIEGIEWNGKDSIEYAYPIIITIYAQNPEYKQDYELKVNIK
jgi:hypothetical protein